MLYPEKFEEKIGFDKIRSIIFGDCLSEIGKEYVSNMTFSIDYEGIKQQIEYTNEFKNICSYYDSYPTSHYFDLRPVLQRLKVEGTHLSTEELFDLRRSLESIRAIYQFFQQREEDEFPALKNLVKSIVLFPFVYDKIGQIINKHGDIKDNASSELMKIRKDLASKQSGISKITHKILQNAKNEGIVDKDTSLTIRDGRMLIPVQVAHKRKIKGFVYDESATGKTAFIEPIETIEINNDIRELEFSERREIIRILTAFADSIRPYIEELTESYNVLGYLDFIRAKAMFALKTQSVKPHVENGLILDYKNARHPLLYLAFKKDNRKVVPLSLTLDNSNRILIISGPNAGGKSVCLKTVGLIQYMFQCGLLVPADESSALGIFGRMFIDIGDDQSLENDLSTYSSHLRNMKYFVEHGNSETLLLIDEFGTGTEPLLGGAIAEAVLKQLNKSKIYGLITTHYTNLKHVASKEEGIINGAMLFDTDKLEPLFVLKTGFPGRSYAFEIAGKIGLSKDILEDATQSTGYKHIDYEESLKQLEKEKKYISGKKKKISDLEKKLESLISNYSTEYEKTLKNRKEIIRQTEAQAKEILDSLNKRIENSIFEIKQAQAEKEKTKHIRQSLDGLKEHVNDHMKEQQEKIDTKLNNLEKKKAKKTKKKTPQKEISKELQNGDMVKIADNDTIGEILSIEGNKAKVVIGNMQTIVPKKRLERVEKQHVSGNTNRRTPTVSNLSDNLLKRKSQFKSNIDIRGKRGDEALQAVREYIDEAIVVEAEQVKILHGTGSGILRQLVRDYLSSVDLVGSYRDEKVQFGGTGITVVDFKY